MKTVNGLNRTLTVLNERRPFRKMNREVPGTCVRGI